MCMRELICVLNPIQSRRLYDVWDPLSYRWLCASMWVLGTKFKSSGRAASAIKHWTSSPGPSCFTLIMNLSSPMIRHYGVSSFPVSHQELPKTLWWKIVLSVWDPGFCATLKTTCTSNKSLIQATEVSEAVGLQVQDLPGLLNELKANRGRSCQNHNYKVG